MPLTSPSAPNSSMSDSTKVNTTHTTHNTTQHYTRTGTHAALQYHNTHRSDHQYHRSTRQPHSPSVIHQTWAVPLCTHTISQDTITDATAHAQTIIHMSHDPPPHTISHDITRHHTTFIARRFETIPRLYCGGRPSSAPAPALRFVTVVSAVMFFVDTTARAAA
jgi:hypothetical protein